MVEQAVLLQEIKTLPPQYFGEVVDFIGYLKQKNITTSEEEAYEAMAADTEREREAMEWCNACFGPVKLK